MCSSSGGGRPNAENIQLRLPLLQTAEQDVLLDNGSHVSDCTPFSTISFKFHPGATLGQLDRHRSNGFRGTGIHTHGKLQHRVFHGLRPLYSNRDWVGMSLYERGEAT